MSSKQAELRPASSIVPIVRAATGSPVKEILGTGFFVGRGDSLHVVTAKHVIADNPVSGDDIYALVFLGTTMFQVRKMREIRLAADYDIATCSFDRTEFPEAVPLALGRNDPALNADVLSYEYSSTRIERADIGMHVAFEPLSHKGNIVTAYTSRYPEKVPTPSVLTSFPALQGASGAPLITATASKRHFAVVGMTVANAERHLLPAQVAEIHDGDSFREKTEYFLPYGKGLARSVVVKCLEGLRVPFEYAEDLERDTKPWWRFW